MDSVDWLKNVEIDGFHIFRSRIDSGLVKDLNLIANAIINTDRIGNLVGLGNRTLRNGNIFTGNLLFKHKIFSRLLLNYGLLDFPSTFLKHFTLSEYILVSSYDADNFSYWWHRDYPNGNEITPMQIALAF